MGLTRNEVEADIREFLEAMPTDTEINGLFLSAVTADGNLLKLTDGALFYKSTAVVLGWLGTIHDQYKDSPQTSLDRVFVRTAWEWLPELYRRSLRGEEVTPKDFEDWLDGQLEKEGFPKG